MSAVSAVSAIVDLTRRAVRFEWDGWVSLARWIGRRPDLAPGDTPLPYKGAASVPIIVFIVMSAFETLAVDLLIPWSADLQWLRGALLVLGVWGTLLMVAMLAGMIVHPHALRPGGLRLRFGRGMDTTVPWDAVAGARMRTGSVEGRSAQVRDGALVIGVTGQYSVEVALSRPVEVVLPRGERAEVETVRLFADDAAAAVRAITERVERVREQRPAG